MSVTTCTLYFSLNWFTICLINSFYKESVLYHFCKWKTKYHLSEIEGKTWK